MCDNKSEKYTVAVLTAYQVTEFKCRSDPDIQLLSKHSSGEWKQQVRLEHLYLYLHALLQQPLGLVLHFQPGSADQQQVVLDHLDAAQIHALRQVVCKWKNRR